MTTLRVLLVIMIVTLFSCQSDITSIQLQDPDLTKLNDLSGTEWKWIKYVDGNDEIITLNFPEPIIFSLRFADSSNIWCHSGCNSLHYSYLIDKQTVKVKFLSTTYVACPLTDLFQRAISGTMLFQANEKELLLKTNHPDCTQMYFKRI